MQCNEQAGAGLHLSVSGVMTRRPELPRYSYPYKASALIMRTMRVSCKAYNQYTPTCAGFAIPVPSVTLASAVTDCLLSCIGSAVVRPQSLVQEQRVLSKALHRFVNMLFELSAYCHFRGIVLLGLCIAVCFCKSKHWAVMQAWNDIWRTCGGTPEGGAS